MEYYYRGVVSWEWFYPHHYAPMISDMTGLAHIRVSFEPGVPFRPFQQLLAVLPAASCKLLPEPYQVWPPRHMHAGRPANCLASLASWASSNRQLDVSPSVEHCLSVICHSFAKHMPCKV